MRPIRDTIPVNLIADSRPALIVGYGKVGQRKERFLKECGAPVTVVSPDVKDSDGAERATRFVGRTFRPGDCKGKILVFACTDDKHVNKAVLEDARRHGVPCCCADMNWADGDFTTPAVVRSGGATVAVSTSGASCMSAKELRRAIGGFLESRAEGRIVVLGTNDAMLPD
ncbi:MAG: bifunctional precorrin-2 dehydrogenase/sirohydrochlorin ferrochelatase, partial [Bacteroidales bacterium]|nr:bifunctional precorrin-2 dehydrogenase/sirohydrochlorin ferrochelatase [Bacteroidales bacterium]